MLKNTITAAVLLVSACAAEAPPPREGGLDAAPAEAAPQDGDGSTTGGDAVADSAPIDPAHLVLAYRDGRSREMDDREAGRRGLTIVDLRDTWAPTVLRGTEELPSSYEEVYVNLANERGDPVEEADPEEANYYLEVYGISPSLTTIRTRMEREESTKCFGELDYETLANFDGFLAYRGRGNLASKGRAFRGLERRIARLLEEQGVATPEELTGSRNQVFARQYAKLAPRTLTLRAAQKRLECEELFPGRGRYEPDVFDWATHIGLLNFERRHRLYGWGYLNVDTAQALSWTPRESAYHTIRRAISERLVDAAEIIEDGSVNNRAGEPPTYVGADGAEHPVRDLVAEFTQAAMGHLGITDGDSTAAFLGEHDFTTLRVALPMPELPEYYGEDMDLSVEIDRGDIWYDYPFDEEGNEVAQPVRRRPTTSLFVRYRGKRVPLVRYGTTIGGWRSEVIGGVEHWAYKNSDVGDRVWRHIIGAPSWIPPESTPVRDLVVKRRRSRRWFPDYAETGPGYASAYGLVMGIHERPSKRADGTYAYLDNGIRSHGSVSYQSIQKRHSHGCHRLHNHLALRLFSYVLDHRDHVRLGQEKITFGRTLIHEEQRVVMQIKTRGYRFELQPPVPVTVTTGRILGPQKSPLPPVIKPEEAERLRREAEEAALNPDGGIVPSGDGGPDQGATGPTAADGGTAP